MELGKLAYFETNKALSIKRPLRKLMEKSAFFHELKGCFSSNITEQDYV